MSEATLERTYQLIRVGAGDWLLPSNDRVTLWRLRSYEEDGSAEYAVPGGWRQLRGTFWSISRYTGLREPWGDDELLQSHSWEIWCTTLSSRAEAIQEALRADQRRQEAT